ncbi:MAG: hypothetical protein K2X44_05305 [Magnetospirillum sp.]|nr:hypothetical protein [Magnetospirillum sp.]
MMKVLAGDWKSNEYAAIKTSMLGKPTHLLMPKGMLSKEKIALDQVASAEIVTDTDSLQRRAGWAALGAVVLGPVGLLAGVLAGKKTVVAVEFKDERRALLECSSSDVAALKAACF